MTPHLALSIIVPTCGRPASTHRLLRALTGQTMASSFEVIVVADGVPASTTGADDASAWPFTVRVAEQRRSGAAAARNHGASVARADMLLFLDDDVEPGAGTVDAHVRFHDRHPSTIGAGFLPPSITQPGFFGSALAGWWEAMGDALTDPRHRFTFRDLLTGHCSVPRRIFTDLGGFDVSMRCHEDFEFGYRAIAAGVAIRYVPGAEALHHDASDLRKTLRRKFDEGIDDVQLVHLHPEMQRVLPLGLLRPEGRLAKVIHHAALRKSTVLDRIVPDALIAAMRVMETLSMRDKWRVLLDRCMEYWYWRGVVERAGGAAVVSTLRAMEPPPPAPLLTIDLADGIDAAEQTLDRERPAGIRVLLNSELVGELRAYAGAEPLRGMHLRPVLLKAMPHALAAAAARSGVLPAPFMRCVQQLTIAVEAGQSLESVGGMTPSSASGVADG